MRRLAVALVLSAVLCFGQVSSIPSAAGGTVGLQGPAGPAGPVGPAGPAGADGAPGVPGYSPNSLLSGGTVVWTGDLDFTVSASTFLINNTEYTSTQTDLTLTAADETLNRFDVFALTSAGTAVVVEGTAAASPAIPDIDPATQLYLTAVYIPAGATTPSNVVSTDIYHENTEWTTSRSGTTITLASTNNPHNGTVDLEATNATSGNYVQFTNGSAVDLSTRNELVFYIRSKAAWASTRSLQLSWYNTNTRVGSIVTFNEAAFGFSSSNTTTYQQIVIPLSLFQANGVTLNRLRITVAGSGTNLGWYIDDITLQGGLVPGSAGVGMTWKGAWSSTTAYAVNDVVNYGGASWVGLVGSANSTPSATNTNWAQMVAPPNATAYASLPAAGVAGRLLLTTDSWLAAQDSGTAWSYYGPLLPLTIPPAISTWTQLNIGTSGLSEAYGGITLTPQNGTQRILYRAQPATPYTISAAIAFYAYNDAGGAGCGIGWRDSSTGNLSLYGPITGSLNWQNYNSSYAFQSNNFSYSDFTWGNSPVLLRLVNNGSTLSVWRSVVGGDWLQIGSEAVGAHLTPDEVLFFCLQKSANPSGATNVVSGTLLSWKVE